MVKVTPSSMLDEVLEFDQLRQKVKFAKARGILCPKTLEQYERASNNLKQQLLHQFKQNIKEIMNLRDMSTVNRYSTKTMS